MATTPTTELRFKVTDKATGVVIKVATIDPTKHNHVSGIEFTKDVLDSIKSEYGNDAIATAKKD